MAKRFLECSQSRRNERAASQLRRRCANENKSRNEEKWDDSDEGNKNQSKQQGDKPRSASRGQGRPAKPVALGEILKLRCMEALAVLVDGFIMNSPCTFTKILA